MFTLFIEHDSVCVHFTHINFTNVQHTFPIYSCRCKPDEQCLRTAKEYRLPGFKYHCKRPDEIKDSLEIVVFPQQNKSNSQSTNSQTGSVDD